MLILIQAIQDIKRPLQPLKLLLLSRFEKEVVDFKAKCIEC